MLESQKPNRTNAFRHQGLSLTSPCSFFRGLPMAGTVPCRFAPPQDVLSRRMLPRPGSPSARAETAGSRRRRRCGPCAAPPPQVAAGAPGHPAGQTTAVPVPPEDNAAAKSQRVYRQPFRLGNVTPSNDAWNGRRSRRSKGRCWSGEPETRPTPALPCDRRR